MTIERNLYRAHGSDAIRHLTNDDRRQLARAGQELGWKRLLKLVTIATVRTIRRWYRELIGKHNGCERTGGRPRTSVETEQLVVQLAVENSWGNDAWGTKRIVGELKKLGISIARSTVSAILKLHGLPPAPERGMITAENQGIAAEHPTTAAIDFAKVMILDQGTIRLMSILIAIHLISREVEIIHVAHHPDGEWTLQYARNMTMADVGFFSRLGVTAVIMDRDPIFTVAFRHCLRQAGCQPRCIHADSPWENGFAERFIRSLREGLLSKTIFTSEAALRLALKEFQEFFNQERPHQGIGNELVLISDTAPLATGEVIRQPRIGGLMNHYSRAA